MLDIQDFIKERGGDPDKIRKSQELRHADVGLVDKVIELFEDHSTSCPIASQQLSLLILPEAHEIDHLAHTYIVAQDEPNMKPPKSAPP